MEDEIVLITKFTFKARCIASANSTDPSHSTVLCNKVSRIFGVGADTAKRTLMATMQLALRQTIHPIHRQ